MAQFFSEWALGPKSTFTVDLAFEVIGLLTLTQLEQRTLLDHSQ